MLRRAFLIFLVGSIESNYILLMPDEYINEWCSLVFYTLFYITDVSVKKVSKIFSFKSTLSSCQSWIDKNLAACLLYYDDAVPFDLSLSLLSPENTSCK